jgi:hypothetical protein
VSLVEPENQIDQKNEINQIAQIGLSASGLLLAKVSLRG